VLKKILICSLALSSQMFCGQVSSTESTDQKLTVYEEIEYVVSNELLDEELIFSGESRLCGGSNDCSGLLKFGEKGSIKVAAGGHLIVEDITLQGLRAENFKCEDSSASVTFKNVHLSIKGAYKFSSGHFNVDGKLSIRGGLFSYESRMRSEILDDSLLEVEGGAFLRFSSKYSNDLNFIKMGPKSILCLDGGCLCIDAQKVLFESGALKIGEGGYFRCSNGGRLDVDARLAKVDLDGGAILSFSEAEGVNFFHSKLDEHDN
jgi:hypothetical protein